MGFEATALTKGVLVHTVTFSKSTGVTERGVFSADTDSVHWTGGSGSTLGAGGSLNLAPA